MVLGRLFGEVASGYYRSKSDYIHLKRGKTMGHLRHSGGRGRRDVYARF